VRERACRGALSTLSSPLKSVNKGSRFSGIAAIHRVMRESVTIVCSRVTLVLRPALFLVNQMHPLVGSFLLIEEIILLWLGRHCLCRDPWLPDFSHNATIGHHDCRDVAGTVKAQYNTGKYTHMHTRFSA
jgi:hypothetical protein